MCVFSHHYISILHIRVWVNTFLWNIITFLLENRVFYFTGEFWDIIFFCGFMGE